MINLNFSIRSFLPDINLKKHLFLFMKGLSRHKTLEMQLSLFSPYHLIDLCLDTSWRGSDHAGINFHIRILFIYFGFSITDNRHWDYDLDDWEKQDN